MATDRYQLLPPLAEDDYERLKADIRQRGVMVPIEIDEDGNILDGHHRKQIADELGISMPTPIVRKGWKEYQKRLHAARLNLARRHMTTWQKVRLGEEIEPDLAEEAKARMAAAGMSAAPGKPATNVAPLLEQKPQRTVDDVAKEVGLGSGRTYERAKKTKQKIEEVAPELLEQLDRGEIDLQDAAKEVKHRERVIEKREHDAKLQSERSCPGAATVVHRPCLDWLPDAPTADLLLTDPPYSTDVSDIAGFAAEWLPLALAKVNSTGRAYVCIGAYPHELAAYLNVPPPNGLVLADVLVWTYRNTLGPSPKLDYIRNWQAILHYRAPDALPLDTTELNEKLAVIDMNAPDGRRGERWHTWQKPDDLAEMLIRHATKPGGIVIDPFSGTGTFILAAARLGRIGRGADADPDMIRIAKERGCE